MFNFMKKKQEYVEPQNEQSDDANLANILGVEEHDTNITAGVDAILDDEAEITTQQAEINSDNVDFYQFNEQNTTEDYSNSETYNEPTSENWFDHQNEENTSEPLSDILDFDKPSESVTDIDTLTDNANPSFYDYNSENTEKASDPSEYDPLQNTETSDIETEYSFEDINENLLNDVENDMPIDLDATAEKSDILSESDWSIQNNQLGNDFAENTSEGVLNNQYEPGNDQLETGDISIEQEAVDMSFNLADNNKPETVINEAGKEETSLPIKEIIVPSMAENHHLQDDAKLEAYRVVPEVDLWQVEEIEKFPENPKIINKYVQQEAWCGDKYQSDLKIEIEDENELEKWSVVVMHHYAVPLQSQVAEIIIDKQPDVVRYASLMRQGGEKLKIFNQSHYKFVMPQNDFFTVQGNVICGRVDDEDSLDILDYIPIPLKEVVNQLVKFKVPMSGLILGPTGTRFYFASVNSLFVSVKHIETDEIVSEYIPSLKDFDNRQSFVLSEQSEETEFRATELQNKLVVNVGSSLYGWNVRFDNEMFMSLRDALDYQARYKKLPSENGEIIHGNKILKFYGVKKMQAREKTVYYSYGRI